VKNTAERWILVVDDATEMRWLLERLLKRAGWSVQTASTGAEALSLLQTHKFDAILLDWRLPDTTGSELAKTIKTIDPSLPIIMVSGSDLGDRTVHQAYADGVIDCFVAKPFLHQEILDAVESAMSCKRGVIAT